MEGMGEGKKQRQCGQEDQLKAVSTDLESEGQGFKLWF